ncbi:hypothetical protein [Lactobacillus gasseri]|uniref:hypothetical protein n=1 Tax=Lactobacillus gasseri TaxID=1596 RepID=UPI00038A400C|nr:hypothetical protein [Lactobacillus gasseri]MCZ3541798.1 hypothetical protein [Lactobacillus gasseri]MCZ3589423.1 hypothetical protein [Lactobacillus gasseri]UJD19657.1 hypothetical protein M497_03650 [Lactobacillus gasseri 2016]
MSTAVIIAMYGCISVSLVIDIEKQIKTQRMLKQLNETMDSHLETCSKVLKKLSKFSNNQEQINQKLKLAENIHWVAIKLIVNEIHSRR